MQGLERTDQLGTVPLVAAGGCGGVAFWVVMYPVDVVKSKLQTQHVGPNQEYSGMMDCARKVLARDGWAGLYRGVGPCLLRSFPANAAAFVAYEAAMRMMPRGE
jgi:solute carrier family 25 (mitochondrial carnitine/acylcarnitine transporter), member 20/29